MYLKKLSKNINFNSKIVKAKIIEVKGSSPNSLDDIILISTDTIFGTCLLYTSPSPRDLSTSRMPSSA